MTNDLIVPDAARERGVNPHAWSALKNTLYPGASDQMVCLVLDYCRARNLDPLLKPVHIVSAWDDRQKKTVETIWPGINLHRTIAARTGEYAGKNAPVFGPEITQGFGDIQMTIPEWCETTVYRWVKGRACAFTSRVYWVEAFSKKSGGAPTAMWIRRRRGQLMKCSEAEALRAAFPEELGSLPVAEESDIDSTIDKLVESTPQDVAQQGDNLEKLAVLVSSANKSWLSGTVVKSEDHRFPCKNNQGEIRWFSNEIAWSNAILYCFSETLLPDEVWDLNKEVHAWFMRQNDIAPESLDALNNVLNTLQELRTDNVADDDDRRRDN
jgi:phage recombination protein Bet